MVVSSLKSTSKRGSVPSSSSAHSSSSRDRPPSESGKKAPLRRSRSVSAASRSGGAGAGASLTRAPSDVSEFANTRDNPLFGCSSSSTSPESENRSESGSVKSENFGGRAGRSASRGSVLGDRSSSCRSNSAQSLSRVDSGRRLTSRGHYGTCENEADNESRSSFNSRKTERVNEISGKTKRPQSVKSERLQSEKWDTSSVQHWEDITSTGSFSETEEATIQEFLQSDNLSGDVEVDGIYETVRSEIRRAVSEIKNDLENVILWKNPLTSESIVDASSELVNPEATELVSDMRREYATKLEQSQERARKLRADLAVEQQRKQELSRILKEILPDPKTPEARKSRPRRKTSIERLKMSRCLTEEAMNYFDECVSISTFDGSDFSSQEDQQPVNGFGLIRTGSSRFLSDEASNIMASSYPNDHRCHLEEMEHHTQYSLSIPGTDLASSCSCSSKTTELINENGSSENLADSGTLSGYSGSRTTESLGFHDIRHYISNFGKGSRDEGSEHFKRKSSYNADDYDLSSSMENLLFDRVIFRNRIDSGGLLLCNIRNF